MVFDRGYTDFTWFNWLNSKGIYFVTRLKANTKYRVISRHPVNKEQGITSDQTLILTGPKADICPIKLRRMGYSDPGTGKHYVFLTHPFELAAKTIADIYKSCWQIELFFKCIKQNLKIKSFVGTSKNAVMTQIGVAMCMYLMVAYLKFSGRVGPDRSGHGAAIGSGDGGRPGDPGTPARALRPRERVDLAAGDSWRSGSRRFDPRQQRRRRLARLGFSL